MTDAIKVNIDAEQINKMVSEAILQSAIGEELKDVVENFCGRHSYEMRRMVNDAMKQAVKSHVRNNLPHDVIKAKCKEMMTEEAVNQAVERVWNSIKWGES